MSKSQRNQISKCAICRNHFVRRSMTHKACSPDCALALAVREREKREAKDLRARKEQLKTRTQWLREAQIEFNKFIRERDSSLPCISCGRFHAGSYDAGHYRSIGAAPQLRFDEDNCHKQCVPCNQHKSGNAIEYRRGLIDRIGGGGVERIEQNNAVRRWTIDDARRIKAEYKAKYHDLICAQKIAA